MHCAALMHNVSVRGVVMSAAQFVVDLVAYVIVILYSMMHCCDCMGRPETCGYDGYQHVTVWPLLGPPRIGARLAVQPRFTLLVVVATVTRLTSVSIATVNLVVLRRSRPDCIE